ncbi:MAG: hypothetical protein ABIN89_25040 [Chitinophagaceae bacterium]
MPLKQKLYYALAILHLLMVALFAAHSADWGRNNRIIKSLGAVGNFTGSNNIFSFFAPGLADQPFVVYDVKDTTGINHVIDLEGSSRDFSNRVNNIYGYLTIPEARMIISASLAKFVMNECPSAEKVRIAMVVQKIPTMPEFRKGERSKWVFWFHRDFERSLPLASVH